MGGVEEVSLVMCCQGLEPRTHLNDSVGQRMHQGRVGAAQRGQDSANPNKVSSQSETPRLERLNRMSYIKIIA